MTGFSRYLAVLSAAVAVGLMLFVAISRIGYPFELEWMEGGTLGHIQRVLDGRTIYVPPEPGFVPFIYPPLYYYLAAPLAAVMGEGFLPPRLVSLVCGIGCGVLTGLLAFTLASRDRATAGFLAGALFLASYGLSGTWFDLARVDSMALLLTLAAVLLFLRGWSVGSGGSVPLLSAAALLGSAACLTKQSAALPMAVLALSSLLSRGRSLFRRAAFPAALALTVGIPALLMWTATDGWFGYYLLRLPSRHDLVLRYVAHGFWLFDVLLPLPVVSLLAFCALWRLISLARKRAAAWSSAGMVGFAALVGMFLSSWLSRAHSGGYLNVLMPAHAALAVMASIGYVALTGREASRGRALRTALQVLMALQIAYMLLRVDPWSAIPDERDREAGYDFISLLGSFQGEVLVPYHPYYPVMAGKPALAHDMAVTDVLRAGGSEGADLLTAGFVNAFDSRRFDAVVLDEPWFFQEALDSNYYRAELPMIFREEGAFVPVTGMETRPSILYLRR